MTDVLWETGETESGQCSHRMPMAIRTRKAGSPFWWDQEKVVLYLFTSGLLVYIVEKEIKAQCLKPLGPKSTC